MFAQRLRVRKHNGVANFWVSFFDFLTPKLFPSFLWLSWVVSLGKRKKFSMYYTNYLFKHFLKVKVVDRKQLWPSFLASLSHNYYYLELTSQASLTGWIVYCEVFATSAYECDLTWEKDLRRYNHRDTQGECCVRAEQGLAGHTYKPYVSYNDADGKVSRFCGTLGTFKKTGQPSHIGIVKAKFIWSLYKCKVIYFLFYMTFYL
jgi:hypothetical protein